MKSFFLFSGAGFHDSIGCKRDSIVFCCVRLRIRVAHCRGLGIQFVNVVMGMVRVRSRVCRTAVSEIAAT